MLANAYDDAGNRIALADDVGLAGAVIGFGFDAANRLTELTTPSGQTIDLAFDPAGRVTGVDFPNTVASTFAYDLSGRLTQLTHARGLTDLADFGYGYDGLGNLTSIAEIGRTRNFTYDALQRLTAGGTAAAPESYTYDAEGNRTASHLSAAHVTDAASRLSEDDGFTYAYDANGNLTSKTAKTGGAVTGYTWDAQDQLVQIDFPDLTSAAYRYDGLGRRIEKDVAGTITRYVYDGEDILLEFDGAGTLLARTSHGQGTDQPLAVERGGQQYFYQADHQGSVRKITDSAGFVVNSYDYDSYGNIEASVEGIANPFTYTGRERDAESGLYYYRARYYDPANGKFLSDDPLGFAAGDFNLSRYVFNNPVNLTDPSGEIVPQLIGGCLLGGAIDAGLQLVGNGGRLGCLDFGEVAGGCALGAATAALGPAAGRLFFGGSGRFASTVRRLIKSESGGGVVKFPQVGSALAKVSRLGKSARITKKFLTDKVIRVHGPNATQAGKSRFSSGFDIRSGIRQTLDSAESLILPNTKNRAGFIFIRDFGRQIGVTPSGKAVTSLKVVIDEAGNLVTAFPLR